MIVKHCDIKTAFLNGKIMEEIYMTQPDGFKEGSQVCKLKKGLYGLKQAARSWNMTIHKIFIDCGYKQSKIDKCLYHKTKEEKICYILVYVDDLVIASKDNEMISEIFSTIKKKFEIVDLGEIKFFLGIKIERNQDGDFLMSQTSYIDNIIESAGLKDAKVSQFPLDPGYEKLQDNKILSDVKIYQRMIGQLLYVAGNTRPDISTSVSILSQKLIQPSETDLNEVKRIIRYLNGTKNLKLKVSDCNQNSKLNGYSDASWGECRIDRKSNSGYIFQLNGGTVSWCCRKQKTVALSSTEAEYIAMAEACQEVIWLRRLCNEFGIQNNDATELRVDNQSCMKMVDNQKFSNRTKHIDIKYHFIQNIKEEGIVNLKYCESEKNVADVLTKPLNSIKLEKNEKDVKFGIIIKEEC